jgi:excisionase family DNA binding protein
MLTCNIFYIIIYIEIQENTRKYKKIYYQGRALMMEVEKVYTPEQIAEHLSLAPKTVGDLLRSGKIPAGKIGRMFRVPATSLQLYIDTLKSPVIDIAQDNTPVLGYKKFYETLLNRLKKSFPEIEFPDPLGICYFSIPTGVSRIHYEFGFHGKGRGGRNSFEVGLHFEKSSKNDDRINIAALDSIIDITTKAQLDAALGEETIKEQLWQPKKKWARIFLLKPEGAMTEELMEWAVQKMTIFIEYLQPEIKRFFGHEIK